MKSLFKHALSMHLHGVDGQPLEFQTEPLPIINASQDEIRLKLLEFEEVMGLARSEDKNGGLFYGERIITVAENGKQAGCFVNHASAMLVYQAGQ